MKSKKLLIALTLLVAGGAIGYLANSPVVNSNQGAAALQGTQSGFASIGKYPVVSATSINGKAATTSTVMPRIIDANSTMGKKIASLISNKGVAPTNTQLTAAASYVSQTVSTTNPNLGVICTAQTFCGTGGTNSVYIHCTDGTSNMLIWHGECEAD